jgi:acyl-coenzyme A synthetase/AMP-(fatty) acid ligase
MLPTLPALAENVSLALISPYVPNQTLVIHNGKAISQQQFLNDLHIVTAQLPADAGFALNLCEDRYYFLLAFCALLIKGAVNLLPPNQQPATLIELAQPYPNCYCLFDKDQHCELPKIILSDLLHKNTAINNAPLPIIPAQQIAAIAFTSGSTGKPKPNQKCWGTLAATARLLGQRLTAHLSLPVVIATVPPQHMYGLETSLMLALQGRAIIHSAKPFYPIEVQQLLQEINSPGILVSTPTHLRAINHAELTMPALAGIVSATAPLDESIAHASEQCFNAPLWEIYGCTEAGAMATRRSTHTQYWQLLNGFSLTIDGDNISADAPHLNEIAPIQDQLTFNKNGEFLLSGRSSDMINVAGKRSSLAHLTLQLLRIEGVFDGVIFLPQKKSEQQENQQETQPSKLQHETRPVALVVSELPEKEILAALAQRIDAVFLPRPLRKVAALPRNETGKLTAAALHSLWSQRSEKH